MDLGKLLRTIGTGVGADNSQQDKQADMGVSQNYGYLVGGAHNKEYSILGSILGSPYFGKLPFSCGSTTCKNCRN